MTPPPRARALHPLSRRLSLYAALIVAIGAGLFAHIAPLDPSTPDSAAPDPLTPDSAAPAWAAARALGTEIGACHDLTVAGDRLYFAYDSATYGRELWVSDGTPEGTHLAVDAFPGPASSDPNSLTVSGPNLYFVADDGVHGAELWRLRLATGDASLVYDINPGPESIRLSELTAWGGLLWMRATADVPSGALWFSNGEALGTRPALSGDIASNPDSPFLFTASPDALHFVARDRSIPSSDFALWAARAPLGAPTRLLDASALAGDLPASLLLSLHGALLFDSTLPSGDTTLWRTDATASGTFPVRGFTDLLPSDFLQHQLVTSWRGDAWILAQSADNATLWVVRGGAAASAQVVSRWPASAADQQPAWVATTSRALWFTSADEEHLDLWRTDGTAAGTQRVVHLHDASQYSPLVGVAIGDRVCIWSSNDDLSLDLSCFAHDTSTIIGVIFPAPTSLMRTWSPRITRGVAFGDQLYLCADLPQGKGLWRINPAGSALSPHLLTPPSPEVSLQAVIGMFSSPLIGERLVFSGFTPESGLELWVIDAPGDTPRLLKDIDPGSEHSLPQHLLSDGARALFQALPIPIPNAMTLWITDGTAAGTSQVKAIAGAEDITPLVWLGPRALLSAITPAHGEELWVSDGTSAGTRLLKDIFPGPMSSSPIFIGATAGLAFFRAETPTGHEGVWVSDATPAKTRLIRADSAGLTFSASGERGVALSRGLIFPATTSAHGDEPWVSDGTVKGTHLLRDIAPGGEDAFASDFTTVGDRAFFRADDSLGAELWVTDGTTAGTHLVRDIAAGSAASTPHCLLAFRDHLIFSAYEDPVGAPAAISLWISDGTAAGTYRLLASPPRSIQTFCARSARGDRVYLSENSGDIASLWSFTVDVTATPAAITSSPAVIFHSHIPLDDATFFPTPQGVYVTTDEPALWFIPAPPLSPKAAP